LAAAGTHVISTDEKTGMQALERLHATKPVRPGLLERVEFDVSATLVELIARRCGIEEDLGMKGKTGILKSKKTRRRFLQDTLHRIRFVYTPRHCSSIRSRSGFRSWLAAS
jgi:hypothetical protein